MMLCSANIYEGIIRWCKAGFRLASPSRPATCNLLVPHEVSANIAFLANRIILCCRQAPVVR